MTNSDIQSQLAGNVLPSRKRSSSVLTALVAVVWLSVIVGAMVVINNYSNSPGTPRTTPPRWPVESAITLDTHRPTLVMFVHPRCPCTRATLGELELLMAHSQGQFTAHLLFIQPTNMTTDWVQTDLWRKAAVIPGLNVRTDLAGLEAGRFQAGTSGQTVLYDEKGNLLFHGGITISRGHSGDSPGRAGIEALLAHQTTAQIETPVFGCSLFDNDCEEGEVVCKR